MRVADISWHRFLVAMIALAVAVAVASFIWWLFPTVLDPSGKADITGAQVPATVVQTAPCNSKSQQQDRVRFQFDGKQREANLIGCGHDKDESVQVVLPDGFDPATSANQTVAESKTVLAKVPGGYRSVAILLVSLAGLAGAGYAFLITRSGTDDSSKRGAAPGQRTPSVIRVGAAPET
ncbi:MAG: hypothetical protein ACRDQ5_26465 [Sciscionella sp.]